MDFWNELFNGIWTLINAISGAGLGASFYVLLKTHPYLVNRSFDPQYNAAYITRFITGVIGGVILAIAIGPTLGERFGGGAGTTLTPGVLAILGGYAAEAVETILQRLVDVLLAIFRGDGSLQVQAKAAVEKAEKAAKLESVVPELEANQGNPVKFKEAIEKLRREVK